MVETFTLAMAGVALVVALFGWGEKAFGNDFFGSKVKVKCYPTRPGLPKPFVRDNVVYLALSTPMILGPAGDEGSSSFMEFTTAHIISIPHGYMGLVSTGNDVLPPDVFLESQILPPGWSGELKVMLGNRHVEKAVSLSAEVHCIAVYVGKVGSPIKLEVRV